ncbi:hypothetical protein B5E41_30555 [Rhizobium esperanzae]|uniref:D-2-hydroxyglutarate dehydrogenase n=1 Tax=Rhizobium esperanzae TaxID=1967781 RepID=A0A246DKN7_9HYPH|nr:FAD-binding and (Fe-S)-binding domain-containing protein [Rhizobium esperanzae]OWO89470.1 hypothetical protein B5E41_30555 [Rhizobium esperanzae]
MIPRLESRAVDGLKTPFFDRLAQLGFRGDVEAEASSRTVFATDNSIYQVEPAGILFPTNIDDMQVVAAVLSEPEFRHLDIGVRGGGTGTNGQALTSGIVIDCSRHMNRILEIDPVRRVARVQAGVIKDQLNRALKPHGLFFAPELSTSNRATIGGMVSTDACGQGSCLYGKTSNHVMGLRIVLTDGSEWWSRPLEEASLIKVMVREDLIGRIHRVVNRIARDERERIDELFPRINRYMTGYDLAHIYRQDGQFDLNSILCGSEGTLAIIAEAELNLLPIPACVALINIRYGDFNAALEDARALTVLKVASVETIDETVLGLARKDVGWSRIAKYVSQDAAETANGINIVEVLADDETELEAKIEAVTKALNGGHADRLGYTIARGHSDVEAIWAMRKRAVGLLGNVDGPVRPIAFVEDTAVPPQNLAAYIREFRALLDEAGVSYGMFGHVDAGVLHVRPALDLTRDDHMPMLRRISDAVVALTRKHGGILWGEHGKGMRSEYVPEFFGDLYPSLQEIKCAFDPDNRLNPGKIATPPSAGDIVLEPLLKIDEVPLRAATDRVIGNEIRSAFDNAAYCNGNGACFDFDESSAMCPSFKATGDRRQSPKGRAMLMREWLRLLAEKGIDPRQEAARLRWRSQFAGLATRIINSVNPRNRTDFSHEVREAMDTCLSCKACAGQCPVKVSVPAFRSKFLELYHGRYSRPLKDPLVAAIETILPKMRRIRWLYNLVIATSLGKRMTRLAGLTALPALPRTSLKTQLKRRGIQIADPLSLATLSPYERKRTVVFVPDAFTAHFDPDVVLAAINIASNMGMMPALAAAHTNGKALHVHGYLQRFETAARRTADYLQGLADLGVTLVGFDPSMTLTFRNEYKAATGIPLTATILLPQEWLATITDRLAGSTTVTPGKRYKLLPHCTERTNVPSLLLDWKKVFTALGIELSIVDAGCCGMAGTFGHETRNRAIAERLYEMSWAIPIVNATPETVMMATGYSCRSQAKEIDAVRLQHPFEVINELLT